MEQNLPRITQYKCPDCGSADVGYSADARKLQCTHCKHTWARESSRDKIVERRLGEGFHIEELPKGFGLDTQLIDCELCGAETSIHIDQVNPFCPFCGSTALHIEPMDGRVVQPAGILPFTYPQKEALQMFQNWIREGWFHPNEITALASLDRIQGVYLPFWTYDAFTESSWSAEAGFYYNEAVSFIDGEGKTQTRQEKKTRWLMVGGYYEKFFDDVLVIASKGISQENIQAISPFPLEEVVSYDPQYIVGWECEVYQKEVKEGFSMADKIMDKIIYDECNKRIQGDTSRNLAVSTRKHDLKFKHILLPVWITTYNYKGKNYQFLVNGNSGKMQGEKPYSPWKIAIAITAIMGIMAIFLGIYQLLR